MNRVPLEVRRIKGGRKINLSKILIGLQRFASTLLVMAILPVGFIPVSTVSSNQSLDEDVNAGSVNLSFGKAGVIESIQNPPVIVLGESNYNRELRLRAEAEAKARAEAAKRLSEERKVISRNGRTTDSRSGFDDIYSRASEAYGVEPKLLKAIHKIETNCSGSTDRKSRAGATGPMQFMPSTWKKYGVDANGDGIAEIVNVEDAIFSAANYLAASGYPNLKKSLWSYNPSQRYYNKVISVMNSM